MVAARTKAFAFAAILVVVSLGFVTAAATSASSALAPLRRGDGFALERPLSRHGTVLAVFVAKTVDGEPQRTRDATVTLTRIDGSAEHLIGSMQTDDNGRALFYVAQGTYRIGVLAGTMTASHDVEARQPQRVSAVFDESGAATWNAVEHKRLERKGETYALVARVVHPGPDGRAPVADIKIQVYEKKDGERTLVGEQTTGPRGNTVFVLHKGPYEVVATSKTSTASQVLRLNADARALFVEDASGLHAANAARAPARSK